MELNDYLIKFLHYIINPIVLLICLPPNFAYKLVSSIITSVTTEDVAGKVVLITGASSGIGEKLAYEYAKRKAKLVLVARRENLLRQVAKKAQELGSPDVITSCADVSNNNHCKRFVEEAINHFGQLDHLVNNAGIATAFFFQESTSIANLTPVMDINFWGSVYPTYFAIPHLKKSKGKIIVNASVAGWLPSPTLSVYGASKAALISFYETLRAELGPKIGITIVCPAFTESEMTRGKHMSKEGAMEVDQEKIAALIGKFPIRDAEDVAKAILDGTCQGKKYVTTSWTRILFLWKVFFPSIIEWYCHYLYRPLGHTTTPEKISRNTGIRKI